MPTILITGANRGLGLEFTRQYAADGWEVLAACRHPHEAAELTALAKDRDIRLYAVDVADNASVRTLAGATAGTAIDVLLNNAGIMGAPGRQSIGNIDYDDWLRVLNVNVLGPVRMAEAFLPHLEAGRQKRVVTLSSRMGSVGEKPDGDYYAYRSSKAGANMALRALAADLAPKAIHFITFHPGWVRTAMGGPSAQLSPVEAVSAMRLTLQALPPDAGDVFIGNDGRPIIW